MCGIVGYIGKNNATKLVLEGLKKLEYRGYDSAGLSIIRDNKLMTFKKKGRIKVLEESFDQDEFSSNISIGHTRWATHGEPNEINAHPHLSSDGKITVVHNGIIENYLELRNDLIKKGYKFLSQTDTEVIPNVIADNYKGDILDAVFKATEILKGAYSIGILDENEPNRLIAVRNSSPLLFAICKDGYFIASDITSVIEHTNKIIYLEDGDIIDIRENSYKIYDKNHKEVEREITEVNISAADASKEGYDHFLIKEIHEQPRVLREVISIKHNNYVINLPAEGSLSLEELKNINKIYITACGTAFHAGEAGKYAIENLAKIPVISEIASEFRYKNMFTDDKSLVIFVSQSGETADTLAALRKAKAIGAKTLAITNVVGSSISREADKVVYCYAGPEISVASTKAYTTQVISLYFLAMDIALKLKAITQEQVKDIIQNMEKIPSQIEEILKHKDEFKKIANSIKDAKSIFYTGRSLDYITAKEGALKLKEISYIHTEAFPSGELKHGSIALIEEGTPVISVATQSSILEKTISNNQELLARGATVISIAEEKNKFVKDSSDVMIEIPNTIDLLTPLLAVIPEQLIAYYASVLLGNDVDKPRNLAKSVTVE
ncbi:MAG: glutamine--fructose-6-phosphate transaminase (isomerizing) [Peptoniphilus sp.]|uniref:glutamine--fructose-6-phosphate transaminase (isomerizing) n=1 Tax=Peptoniphilus sp. TaxID=1971214 RepID=UPI0025D2EF46|nr:glutamine--fructose-6-phosphate transaminase (isomerizing) [Peptoniphilus sp.]MCI5643967.1 glutamine--fructose-6-phosphate transaminase (isomerizing) [Peptoniphilus sp.]MDD7353430.1 glutamine--fructose-6-phosphate transaminase (isomerizing) [Peptoniphilaceae bacterium]